MQLVWCRRLLGPTAGRSGIVRGRIRDRAVQRFLWRHQGRGSGRRNPARCRGGAGPYEGRGNRHPCRPGAWHGSRPRRLGRSRPRLHQGKCGDVMITINETARILIEALPYIRRFTGKTIVVKVGGLPMTDPARMRSLAKDILLLHSVGIRPVLVHCGGPQIDDEMAKAVIKVERVEGLRVTNAETLDIVRMVLVGKTNRDLVAAINALEPVAIGVAGE